MVLKYLMSRHSRSVFFAHGVQLGLNMPKHKLEALNQGDLSGNIIHPVIVHIAHLWGCIFLQNDRIIGLDEEATHLQLVLESLAGPVSPNLVTLLQAYCLIGIYFFFKRELYRGREFLLKASNIVLQYNLHITLPSCKFYSGQGDITDASLPLVANDEGDELRNALCQLVYVDKVSELLLHLPPVLNSQLDEDFRTILASILLLSQNYNPLY